MRYLLDSCYIVLTRPNQVETVVHCCILGFILCSLFFSLAHSEDIGIECLGLAKLNSSFWKGIEFSSSRKPSLLQYVDVFQAYEAITGEMFLPDLDHVTIKTSVYGVKSANLSSPLTVSDSSIRGNLFTGIQINGRSKNITIKNTAVDFAFDGHGLNYSQISPDPVDFCSTSMGNITSFPIVFLALGKVGTTVDCAKVSRNNIFRPHLD